MLLVIEDKWAVLYVKKPFVFVLQKYINYVTQ